MAMEAMMLYRIFVMSPEVYWDIYEVKKENVQFLFCFENTISVGWRYTGGLPENMASYLVVCSFRIDFIARSIE
jgi:hypothetical protein